MTHGLQLLPQQSPAAGFAGLLSLIAALRRADSRTGASRDLRRRVNVGECFRASLLDVVAIATGHCVKVGHVQHVCKSPGLEPKFRPYERSIVVLYIP